MTSTAIAEAMRKAGFNTGARLHAVACGCLADEKGDLARAGKALWRRLAADTELRMEAMLAILQAAGADMQGMSGGATAQVPQGQGALAPARHSNGGEAGHEMPADEGQLHCARPPSNSRGTGATSVVPKGQILAAPAREPTAAQKRAAGAVAKKSAAALAHLGWMEKAKIPNGARLTDLRWRDIPGTVERLKGEAGRLGQYTVALMAVERAGGKLGVMPPDNLWADDLPKKTIADIARHTEPDVLRQMAAGWLGGFATAALTTVTEGKADA